MAGLGKKSAGIQRRQNTLHAVSAIPVSGGCWGSEKSGAWFAALIFAVHPCGSTAAGRLKSRTHFHAVLFSVCGCTSIGIRCLRIQAKRDQALTARRNRSCRKVCPRADLLRFDLSAKNHTVVLPWSGSPVCAWQQKSESPVRILCQPLPIFSFMAV